MAAPTSTISAGTVATSNVGDYDAKPKGLTYDVTVLCPSEGIKRQSTMLFIGERQVQFTCGTCGFIWVI